MTRHPLYDDVLLLELRLGGIAKGVVRAFARADSLFLPVDAVLNLVELPSTRDARTLSVLWPTTGVRVTLSAASGLILLPGVPVAAGVRAVVADVPCLPLHALRELLGTAVSFDVEEAVVHVYPRPDFPIVRRIERERQRAALSRRQDEVLPAVVSLTGTQAGGGVAIDYDIRGFVENESTTLFNVGAATPLVGGTLASSVQSAAGGRGYDARLNWSLVRASGLITQGTIGDGVTSGPHPDPIRGFLLTNAPPFRPLIIESMPFDGVLRPGWSVDAMRAGELVAFDSTDAAGRYSITLPLHYGENPVDFVAHGPRGEIRTFNQTFRAVPTLLPSGAREYAMSAGRCWNQRCAMAANADFRVGLTRRLTARAGADYRSLDGGKRMVLPYAAITAAPRNSWSLDVDALRSTFARTSVRYEPSTAIRVVGDAVAYATDPASTGLAPPGLLREYRVYSRFAPSSRSGAPVLETQMERVDERTARRMAARAGVSWLGSGTMWRPYGRVEHRVAGGSTSASAFAGLEAVVLPRVSLGPVLGRVWLRGQYEMNDAGRTHRAGVVAARELWSSLRLEGDVRWDGVARTSTYSLGIVTQLPGVRHAVRSTSEGSGGFRRSEYNVAGSMVWDLESGRALFSADPAIHRTGIAMEVFLDRNADGVRQAGEPAVAGARVIVAGRYVVADSSGRAQLWGLQSFEPVTLSVDTMSLPAPNWIPAYASATVTPRPGGPAIVRLPIEIGATLEGRLGAAGPDSAIALSGAIPLVLVNERSGERRRFESFRDGTFYQSGVRPGDYRLFADPELLAATGLASDTVSVRIPPAPMQDPARPMGSASRLSDLVVSIRTRVIASPPERETAAARRTLPGAIPHAAACLQSARCSGARSAEGNAP